MNTDSTFVLGVDLDGVCADYTTRFAQVVAEEQSRDISEFGEQHEWSFVTADGWGINSREEYLALHQLGVVKHRMFSDMAEIPDASDTLWRMSDAGIHIRIVTHRLIINGDHNIVGHDTFSWLNEARPDGRPRIPYRDITFLGSKQEIEADMYIDDSPHNIEALRRARRDVIAFDASYNRTIKGLRASNWTEVEKIVMSRVSDRSL